jgi:uncharacterized repeat protein (TIGR03803 family)
MGSYRFNSWLVWPVVVFTALAAVDPACAQQAAETVLHSFGATSGDGLLPNAGLTQASDGSLYGTTARGGAFGAGTVFKITTSGAEMVLHSFSVLAADGVSPEAGLIQASDGILYGTTLGGGAYGRGTVFMINRASGAEKVLHSFGATSDDGWQIWHGVIEASDGKLYGTTQVGGAYDGGTVFRINRASGAEKVLYSFGATAGDGSGPSSELIQARDGNLYGTTLNGGAYGSAYGGGTVFMINRASGAETLVHSFGGPGDGSLPSSLIQASDGTLYGTTMIGGANGNGTVFWINRASGAETVVHSFDNVSGATAVNDSDPFSLVQAHDGNLYGTTWDASKSNSDGTVFECDGTVFEINRASGDETVLHVFGDGNDGVKPLAGLIQAADGNLYGTTVRGGANPGPSGSDGVGGGTVFKIELGVGR